MTHRIALPFPPRKLNPNARPHRFELSRLRKRYKNDCWTLAKANGLTAPDTERIGLRLAFAPPDRRHYDDDNLESAFKAGRDGIALAVGVDDRRFKVLSKTIVEPVPGGCVTVELVPLTDD